ncbi:hypothetical protein ACFOEY_16940 [Paracandidimonas soli]|uniref:hypothetical protein n=1 Tax=Paracandidimonas soli TaxID=1917182 RepID=UPI00361557C7
MFSSHAGSGSGTSSPAHFKACRDPASRPIAWRGGGRSVTMPYSFSHASAR